jgi:hypothetical protein
MGHLQPGRFHFRDFMNIQVQYSTDDSIQGKHLDLCGQVVAQGGNIGL